jgi:hypothetical protein
LTRKEETEFLGISLVTVQSPSTLVRFMRSGGSHRRLYTRSALAEEFQPS